MSTDTTTNTATEESVSGGDSVKATRTYDGLKIVAVTIGRTKTAKFQAYKAEATAEVREGEDWQSVQAQLAEIIEDTVEDLASGRRQKVAAVRREAVARRDRAAELLHEADEIDGIATEVAAGRADIQVTTGGEFRAEKTERRRFTRLQEQSVSGLALNSTRQ